MDVTEAFICVYLRSLHPYWCKKSNLLTGDRAIKSTRKNPGIATRVERDNCYETEESTKSGFSDLITLTSPPSTSTIALSPALT